MNIPYTNSKKSSLILAWTVQLGVMFCLVGLFAGCVSITSIQQRDHKHETVIPEPTSVPAAVRSDLRLDVFYQQWIDVGGLPIVASRDVNPYALKEAAWLIRKMLEHRQDILQALVHNDIRFVVIADNEMTTQIPEYNDLKPDFYWDVRARGLGARLPNSIASCGEENLLSYPGDPYRSENILIHEFSHAIHLVGLKTVDPSFDGRLKEAFDSARKEGLWKNTYAITNREEYWAEGTQSWFNTNWTNDSVHNHVKTRKQLKKYDPKLGRLLTEVFGDTDWRYTQVKQRTHLPHLKGFNPKESPTFEWPSNLPNFGVLDKQLLTPNSNGSGKWINLKKQDSIQITNLKSKPNYTETAIIFVNRTETDIAYYWVDYQGNERFFLRISPNYYKCQGTHVGHYWIVKDMKGRNLAVFRAEKETGRAFVTTKP